VQVLVRLDPDQLRLLDDWSRGQPGNPTRTEALRSLVILGMRKERMNNLGGATAIYAAIVAGGILKARSRLRKPPLEGRSRGRPKGTARGVGLQINVRMEKSLIADVDEWRRKHPGKPNRPEALRLFMLMGAETPTDGGYGLRSPVFATMVTHLVKRRKST
jgi:hypothetical protein